MSFVSFCMPHDFDEWRMILTSFCSIVLTVVSSICGRGYPRTVLPGVWSIHAADVLPENVGSSVPSSLHLVFMTAVMYEVLQ